MLKVNLINGDCLEKMKDIQHKINMVLVDLPYGQTDCEWDNIIDLNKMWIQLKKICSKECVYVFFCTSKFGYKLIQSNETWFRYDLVWEKSRTVGFLSANKMPLRKHEMIYIFSCINNNVDLDNSRNLGLRLYFKNVIDYIDKPKKDLIKNLGQCIDHPLRINSTQFALPTEKTYNKLIEVYNIDNMKGFRTLKDLREEWDIPATTDKTYKTYNPQKTKGKPYKSKDHNYKYNKVDVYGMKRVPGKENKTGDRLPTSILKFNNPKKSLHSTQKPTDLCEWLIRTYSNENDYILDFTMGSGTTGIACLNTNRNFIGIEKDEKIFKTARNRMIEFEIKKFRLISV
jgi:DNA modification methylase